MLITAIGLAFLYFAYSGFNAYLNHRLQAKIESLHQEEREAQLNYMKFAQEQATKRANIMARVINSSAK